MWFHDSWMGYSADCALTTIADMCGDHDKSSFNVTPKYLVCDTTSRKKTNIHLVEILHCLSFGWRPYQRHMYSENFDKNRKVHDYFIRQQDKFYVPNAKHNYMQRTISYRGVISWNHITKHISYDRSLLSFKFALQKFVIDDDTLLDFL